MTGASSMGGRRKGRLPLVSSMTMMAFRCQSGRRSRREQRHLAHRQARIIAGGVGRVRRVVQMATLEHRQRVGCSCCSARLPLQQQRAAAAAAHVGCSEGHSVRGRAPSAGHVS